MCDIFAREARYDTVNQSCANVVVFLKPLFEALVICSEIVFPKLDILADAVFQMVTVQENQLARHKDQTFLRIAVECFVATEEQLNELARISRCRGIREFAGIIKRDSGLGGVRNHETDLRLVGKSHEGCVLAVRIQRTADHVNTLERVDCLAIQTALQIHVIEAVLTVEPLHHSFVNRLNNYYRTVEVRLCVHVPYDPVNKCAKEVTLAKLNDFLRHHALRSCELVQCFFCHSSLCVSLCETHYSNSVRHITQTL